MIVPMRITKLELPPEDTPNGPIYIWSVRHDISLPASHRQFSESYQAAIEAGCQYFWVEHPSPFDSHLTLDDFGFLGPIPIPEVVESVVDT